MNEDTNKETHAAHHGGGHGCPMGTMLHGRIGALAAGLVMGLAGRELVPRLLRVTRPYVKEGIKLGLAVNDQVRVVGAEVKESWGDLVAEAAAEYRDEQEQAQKPLAES